MGSSQHASRCRDGAWRVTRGSAASGPKVRRNPPHLKATPVRGHLEAADVVGLCSYRCNHDPPRRMRQQPEHAAPRRPNKPEMSGPLDTLEA